MKKSLLRKTNVDLDYLYPQHLESDHCTLFLSPFLHIDTLI